MKRHLLLLSLWIGTFGGGLLANDAVSQIVKQKNQIEADGADEKKLPLPVRNFLKSASGDGFHAEQFLEALNKTVCASEEKGIEDMEPIEEFVESEDFSLWIAGSDTDPDDTDICDELDAFMARPGWTGLSVFQAGGAAFLGMYEDPEDGASPGYLLSAPVNLDKNDGAFKIRFRAKSQLESQSLQFFCMNLDKSSIIGAKPIGITDEWGEYELSFTGGCEETGIMFYGSMTGNVYVDDFRVYSMNYGITRPEVVSAGMSSCSELDLVWTKVKEATSYVVNVYARDGETFEDTLVLENYETISADTICHIDGLEFNPANSYYVTLRARNDDYVSLPTSWADIALGELSTPVVCPATEISSDGFTANWEKVGMAWNYVLNVTSDRIARQGEEFVFIDEDFSKFSMGGLDEVVGPVEVAMLYESLDEYLSQAGWTACLAYSAGLEAFVTTNLAAADGFPGMLMSPVYDFSIGGGVVNISFDSWSIMGNDLVLLIGFADAENTVNVDEAELVEVGSQSARINVQLTGGKKDSRLVISMWDGETDFVAIDNLKITMSLNEGDQYVKTVENLVLDRSATSYRVDLSDEDQSAVYKYKLKASYPYYDGALVSEYSDIMSVEVSGVGLENIAYDTEIRLDGNTVLIENIEKQPVYIYDVEGRLLYENHSCARDIAYELPLDGFYLICVGNRIYKVVK